MKTFLIGFLIFGLTNLGHSQNEIAATAINHAKYHKSKKEVKNIDYLTAFDKADFSKRIKEFQKAVANYDIKTASIYTLKDPSTYEIVFKDGNDKITAVYNQDGTIISCEGMFDDIKLPNVISSKISKTHPGWKFKKVKCSTKYTKIGHAEITYKVVLKRGRKKKTVKMGTL